MLMGSLAQLSMLAERSRLPELQYGSLVERSRLIPASLKSYVQLTLSADANCSAEAV
jgi:hypothetical protein